MPIKIQSLSLVIGSRSDRQHKCQLFRVSLSFFNRTSVPPLTASLAVVIDLLGLESEDGKEDKRKDRY